ncbi:MAG: M16 family metallopeptidase [Bdellovibrionales bacterium]
MNKWLFVLLIPVLFSCTTADHKTTVPEGVTTLHKANPKKLRPYSEHTLSNGLRVLLIKDDSLPLIGFHMLVKSGYTRDQAGAWGTSQMVAALLEKGTQKRNATQIADDLAQIGADFSAAADADMTYLSATGLSLHREKVLENFVEIITKPSFQDVEIERLRKQILARQTQAVDNASQFASQAFQEYLYGAHPYGRQPMGKKQDVAKIKKAQIIRFYLENVRPNNSILAVVGDYPDQILIQLENALKAWRSRRVKTLEYGKADPIQGVKFRLVHKADLNQAQIRMGHEGISRANEDFLTLRLANIILGQGFSSRLVDQVRDNLGLTYHISSDLEAMLNTGGFEISTFTRNDKASEAINEILKVYKKFVSEGVTSAEVENAKGFLQGGFGRALETAERLAYNLLLLRSYGISDSYLTDFEDNVDRISAADVNRVIKTYFRPEHMKVLVFSNQSLVRPLLKQWEPIEVKSPSDLL